ncbi:heparinase [Desertihabitans brevis]|uniref:Heparinase n=1 Tax=Desertihabitans brevis TaxID=2268447 RepID=A0A367YSW6_9ACTN|nr:heparinase II/III family protein [Desertihabitans brevis]RCK68934.1 heparinase [Desertihabitans brevis]
MRATPEASSPVDEVRPYDLPADPTLPYGRGPLTAIMPPAVVREALGTWHPFPTVAERAAWDAVPAPRRREVVERAEAALTTPWPELRASLFAEFHRVGNRARFELSHFARRSLLRDLVLGAGLTGDARFDDPVMDAVWSICEESFWGLPAHSFSRRHARLPLPATDEPVVDLFAAESGAQLAWTRHVMGERLVAAGGEAFDERVVAEIDRRLLTPVLERDDWQWLAKEDRNPNNWTPWICSNLLVTALLTEADADRRAVLVSKVIASLDAYVAQLLPDGGCSEGQSYWAVGPAKLLDCLEALRGASGGRLDGFGVPEVAVLSRYPVAMHVGGRRMVQHADGHGQWLLEASVLHRAGRLLDDPEARQLAVHLRDLPSGRHERARASLWRGLSELFEPGYADAPSCDPPFPQQRWFPDLQVLTARQTGGSAEGLMLCMKAGHNAEHHNHNDVGGLSIALDGQHVVVDPAVGVYSGQTFGPRRYELFEMNSDWHSLPVVSGTVQQPGGEHAARAVRLEEADGCVGLTADLAPAWPAGAGLESYVRTAILDRTAGRVEVTDTWQGAGVSSLVLPLTLAVEPHLGDVEDGQRVCRVGLRTATGTLVLDVEGARVDVETRDLDDPYLRFLWGERLWRLLLTPTDGPQQGQVRMVFHRGPVDPRASPPAGDPVAH